MSKENKKKMFLIGPGFGHNTEGRLHLLNVNEIFEVTFLAFKLDKKYIEKYPNIKFVNLKSYGFGKLDYFIELANILYHVLFSGRIDVMYVLGVNGLYTAPVFKFAPKGTVKAYEIWSTHVLDNNIGSKLLKRSNSSVIKNADFICQYWWGIKEKFDALYPDYSGKFLIYQLSYSNIYFSDEKHVPESEFVKKFLQSIPSDQVVCFWPRSFIPSNNHGLLLNALGRIKNNNPQLLNNFMLYLWGGNVESKISRRIIEDAINNNHLGDNVTIVDHPYVSKNDIFAIEERCDFFVQIANDDILSSYIMEMICSCKPFILSNLRTFQFLNEVYDLDIDLVDNDVELIVKRIEDILSHNNVTPECVYLERKVKCIKAFSKSNVTPWYKILDEAITKKTL